MSEKNNNSYNTGGCLLPSLLTTLFVGLKLTDHIDWSWLWVLAPLWIPLAIGGLVVIVAGVVTIVIAMVKK